MFFCPIWKLWKALKQHKGGQRSKYWAEFFEFIILDLIRNRRKGLKRKKISIQVANSEKNAQVYFQESSLQAKFSKTFILSQRSYRHVQHVSKTFAGFIYISAFIVNMKTVQNICDRLRSLSHWEVSLYNVCISQT